MPSRDINEVYFALADDERFKGAIMARGRGIVDDVLVFEIRIEDFEVGPETTAALQEVAERENLTLTLDKGKALLRQRPQVVA